VTVRVFDRGDIIALSFDPTKGREQQGARPALVLTPKAINRLGLVGVCPITQGGNPARAVGMAVSLMGAGTQTQGIVLVQQFRMIDTAARAARLIERAPDDVTEEVRARVTALVD
jgi:mRNA interferase ChpB